MFLAYFTEQPMSAYPEDEGLKAGYTSVLFSNKFFDPVEGSRLYRERLAEYLLADEVGFDGIMVNEHHNAPYCMQPRITVWSSILAAVTKNVKIVQLGNPLPTYDSPLAFAEEIAMIDMISEGRLVSGIVRGAGQETIALNANPAFNRDRFNEAHDLLVKIFTEDGPFAWEGEHYQYRVVNPWARVLQKPHPRIWVPGVFSPETIEWSAEHRYPYISLNTPLHLTGQLWSIYDDAARRVGYEPGPENRGYLLRVHVQDTTEKALAGGREFMWMQGEFTGVGYPYWVNPPGYGSPSKRLDYARYANAGVFKSRAAPFEDQLRTREIVAGTPERVIEELRVVLETCRPSILMLWGNDGKVPHEDSMRCIELMGREVLPALREIGDELGLHDPFELDTPVSLKFTP
ncbi:MAG TPA: LLM class flavin-dependent oxidoreductase [Acidimicrobiales bacterium]|jgi:alkanesulfonate monooxygenase SsuD/methylene tetrahydromethanopterin reductase-like flavin-dependent oxidoreductase (luciferase family)|nr:LLM class flavin-dependent oxidoreductase [Acidimicrobiales bacterium]